MMDFRSPVAGRTPLQEGKLVSSSRGVGKKKGGTFSSKSEVNKASSSTSKKPTKPAGAVRTGKRGKSPPLRRNQRDDSEEEIISIGDTDSDSDSESSPTDLRDAGGEDDPCYGSGGSSDLRSGAERNREIPGRRTNGGERDDDDDDAVISIGSTSSDDEEDSLREVGDERLFDTDSGTEEFESSAESEDEDSEDDDFNLSSESEREEGENEQIDTPNNVDVVQRCKQPSKERKAGRPRAQRKENAGSSQKGADGGLSNPELRSVGLHLSRKVDLSDAEVISIGLTDEDDMDDFHDDFHGVQVLGAVSSRTRSKVGPRMSMRGVRGPASLSSSHRALSKKSLGPRRNKVQKMKKGGGKRKSERDSGGSTYLKEKNEKVERHSQALSSSMGHAKKQKAASDIHQSEDSGGSDGKPNSSRLRRKNEKVERHSEAVRCSIRPTKKRKTDASDIQGPEDSGGSDEKPNSSRLRRKNEKVGRHSEALRSSMRPTKKRKPDASYIHGSEDSGGSDGKLNSSRLRRKNEKVERPSEALSSSMGPTKKQKPASDIHESEDSGGSDDKSNQSSSSDHASSTIVQERRAPPRSSNRITRKFDFFQILADSIWKKGETGHEVQEPQQITEHLPVKFPWFDEEEPVEKSKEEEEMEYMWNMMNLSLQADQIGSFPHRNEDEDVDDSEFKTSQAALCRRGKHYLILDEEIGKRCCYCSYIEVEIDGYCHPFEKSPSEKQQRSYHRDKGPAALDGLQFQAPESCSAGHFSPSSSGTVWDLIPGIKNQMYPHQIGGFEFMWRNLAGSIILDELRNSSLKKPKDIGGCIISHAPGTGKTRLTLVFLQAYLELFPDSLPVIIAPASLLLTWEDEIKKWEVGVPFHNLNTELSGKEDTAALQMLDSHRLSRNSDSIRMVKLLTWTKSKSILILSYELLVKLAGESAQLEMRKILLELPGLIILDEGHIPRNRDSKVWNLMLRFKTKKRVILSGTPFQNNFDELHNTLYVIRPRVAETIPPHLRKFCQRRPGAQIDRDPDAGVEEMKKIVVPFVHLHKGSILQESLPGLRDSVVVLNPSELQAEVLRSTQGGETDSADAGRKKDCVFDFEHKQALISVHPSLALSFELEDRSAISSEKLEAHKLNPNEGVKTRFLVELLRLCLIMDEKVLIFSQYLKPLDLIALQLGSVFHWTKGREVLLMIGDLRMNQRQSMIKLFNNPDSEARVLLASTKACSEGINLVGASRVILLDVVWNPSVEKQAISRAYRLGQRRVVYTYHLIMKGTTEWEKYQRQAHKYRLSELVFSASTSSGESSEKKPVVISDDKILEEMTSHPKLRDLFDQIRYQPKQLDLVENFGPPHGIHLTGLS